MRIVIVAGEPGPSEAQAASRLGALAAALRPFGHQVSFAVRRSAAGLARRLCEEAPARSVAEVTAGPASATDSEGVLHCVPALADALTGLWTTDRPDLVHACGLDAGLAALAALRRSPGTPLVLERLLEQPGGGACTAATATRLRQLQSLLAREADQVLARTPWEARLLRRRGAPARRVAVLPLPVDTDLFTPDPHRASTGPPGLLSLDGARSPMAVPLLTAALTRLPGVLVTLAGGPVAPSRAQLRRIPEVPHPEVPGLLADADLLVAVPGRAAGGSAVLEAMACGLPVVAVETVATQDLVVDGVTGTLVPAARPVEFARAVRRLLADPALREAMGAAAADRARARHAWPLVARHLDALYPSTAVIR